MGNVQELFDILDGHHRTHGSQSAIVHADLQAHLALQRHLVRDTSDETRLLGVLTQHLPCFNFGLSLLRLETVR